MFSLPLHSTPLPPLGTCELGAKAKRRRRKRVGQRKKRKRKAKEELCPGFFLRAQLKQRSAHSRRLISGRNKEAGRGKIGSKTQTSISPEKERECNSLLSPFFCTACNSTAVAHSGKKGFSEASKTRPRSVKCCGEGGRRKRFVARDSQPPPPPKCCLFPFGVSAARIPRWLQKKEKKSFFPERESECACEKRGKRQGKIGEEGSRLSRTVHCNSLHTYNVSK